MSPDGSVTIGFTTVSSEGKVVRQSKFICVDDGAIQFLGLTSNLCNSDSSSGGADDWVRIDVTVVRREVSYGVY